MELDLAAIDELAHELRVILGRALDLEQEVRARLTWRQREVRKQILLQSLSIHHELEPKLNSN